ncbi:MAG: DUF368 domain-containing protein, partial [Bacillota bacterium]|nr:DUF368 domain-containing protein [Bacillota bacterium]
MLFIKRALTGLLIGVASIMPGVSGGVIAAAMGIYEPAVSAVSNLRKSFRKSFLFLLPLAIGGGIGVLLFSNVIKFLFANYPYEVLYAFFGFVLGSVPPVIKVANEKGFRPKYLWPMAAALLIVLSFSALELATTGQGLSLKWSFLSAMLYGVIIAVGMVVPGISTSFILIYLGVYHEVLAAISTLDIIKLIPVGIGFIIGVLPLVKLADYLFSKYHAASYYGVLGFLLGSMITVFPGFRTDFLLIFDLILFCSGILVSVFIFR